MTKLPAHSRCNEETVLKVLLRGSKTFEEVNRIAIHKTASRIIRRLKKVNLIETPKGRAYVFFFRSKRDPSKSRFSYTESKVYCSVADEGISAQKLAEKTGLTTRTTYKYLRRLKGKKLVFSRKMPKAYRLTVEGEKLALLLYELHSLVDETLRSSEQFFKDNENITPQVASGILKFPRQKTSDIVR
jgi:predicted transcriptional regulator